MKDFLLGILTFPLRLLLWTVLEILRISPLGKEKDAWVMTAFAIFSGVGSMFIYKWGYAGLEFFLGRRMFHPGWPVWTFTTLWFIPIGFVVLRLLTVIEQEWFINYWNCPLPSLTLEGKRSNHGDPVFNFGDMVVKESALFLGVICSGGIGSGKTATFVYPFLDQLLKRYNEKREGRPNVGGLLLDVKGEFLNSLITLMRQNGRNPEEDIILINPDDPYSQRYNPIVRDMHHLQVAGRFRSILNNLSGAGGDPFWIDSAEKVLGQAILLMRINKDIQSKGKQFVTLADVNKVVADKEYCQEQVNLAHNYGVHAHPEGPMTVEKQLEHEDLIKNIAMVKSYFEKEWLKMPDQTRMGVVAAVSNQLLRGFTDPKLQRVFCQDTDFDFYETCNQGRIVVLQAPGWGQTALMIGAALKLDFQQCMKNRLFRDVDRKRVVLFLADEYQEFVTCGGQSEGDETFYAVSRQSRVVNAVATQSYNSLYSKVKGRESVKTLLQNLRLKVCLNGECSETAKHVAELCGKVEKERWSSWSKDGGIFHKAQRGKNRTYSLEEKPVFEEWDFYKLQTKVVPGKVHKSYSEAIVFNGGAAPGDAIARKVRLVPIWLDSKEKDRDKDYWDKNRAHRKKLEGKKPGAANTPVRDAGDNAAANGTSNPTPSIGLPGKPVASTELPPTAGLEVQPLDSPFQPPLPAGSAPSMSVEANDPASPIQPPSSSPSDPFQDIQGVAAKPSPAPRGDTLPSQPRPDPEAKLKAMLTPDDIEDSDDCEPSDYPYQASDGVPSLNQQAKDRQNISEEDDVATSDDAVSSQEDAAHELYKFQRQAERIRKSQIEAHLSPMIPTEVTQINLLDSDTLTLGQLDLISTQLVIESHRQSCPRPAPEEQGQNGVNILNNTIEPNPPLMESDVIQSTETHHR